MEGRKRDWWFIGISSTSIFYFIAVWSILAINLIYSPTPPDGLNSIGDYLAGAFSPLAFFWLAYGYWMQNRELKQNTNSLQKRSELEMYNIIREFNLNQPLFIINLLNHEDLEKYQTIYLAVENKGANIRNVKISHSFIDYENEKEKSYIQVYFIETFNYGDDCDFEIFIDNKAHKLLTEREKSCRISFYLSISFVDTSGNYQTKNEEIVLTANPHVEILMPTVLSTTQKKLPELDYHEH